MSNTPPFVQPLVDIPVAHALVEQIGQLQCSLGFVCGQNAAQAQHIGWLNQQVAELTRQVEQLNSEKTYILGLLAIEQGNVARLEATNTALLTQMKCVQQVPESDLDAVSKTDIRKDLRVELVDVLNQISKIDEVADEIEWILQEAACINCEFRCLFAEFLGIQEVENAKERRAEQEAIERLEFEHEAAEKRRAEIEAAKKRQAEQDAAKKRQAEQDAAKKRQAEQDAAKKRQAEQDAAKKRQAEQDAAKKRQAEQDAAKKRQVEIEAAKKRQAEQDAAKKRQAEQVPPVSEVKQAPLSKAEQKALDQKAREAVMKKLAAKGLGVKNDSSTQADQKAREDVMRKLADTGVLVRKDDAQKMSLTELKRVLAKMETGVRVNTFEKSLGKVWTRASDPRMQFPENTEELHALLRLYARERVGITELELEQDCSQFALVFRLKYETDVYLVRSPWGTGADIVFWLEQKALKKACEDLFGDARAPQDPLLSETIENAFEKVKEDPSFLALRLRDAGQDQLDPFGLRVQVITNRAKNSMTGSMLQFTLWYHMGVIARMAGPYSA